MIPFNRGGIGPAICGCLMIMYAVIKCINHEPICVFGNTEFGLALMLGGGLGLITSMFRPANRKIPEFLLKPRKTSWPMPRDQAFEKLKEALRIAAVQNSAGGTPGWQPVQEDKESGVLQYKRTVQEYSDELPSRLLSGEMTMAIKLSEENGKTQVVTQYEVLSELTTLRVTEVVGETNLCIDRAKG